MAHSLEPDIEHLLSLARQGEPDALGALLDQYRTYLTLLARLQIHRRLQAKADASDVVQETFLAIHRSFGQFNGATEAELLSWLRQVLASCVAGLVRQYYGTAKRDPRLERDISDELDRSSQTLDRSLAASHSSPSRTATRREQAVRLANALEKLPPDYREVITLHHLQDLSFLEVAKQMGRTAEAARKLWIRAGPAETSARRPGMNEAEKMAVPSISGVQPSSEEDLLPVDDPRVIACVEAYHARIAAGERPDRGQLLLQFPELAKELSACLDGLEFLHCVAPQLKDPKGGLGQPGTLEPLGDFRLIRELGRGGMGVVYEAEQLSLGRRVALKVLPFAAVLDPRQLRRFKSEAQAAALLKHPNIVSVYSVGCERGVHFYAMELVDGWSLAEVIGHLRPLRDGVAADGSRSAVVGYRPDVECGSDTRRRCPTPSARGPQVSPTADTSPIASLSTEYSCEKHEFHRSVARLAIQAAEALEYAGQEGVVHRDIKPSNLLLDTQGKLWIADFGLAQVQDTHNLTMTGDVLGTLRYMSPEQAAGRKTLDHRTDVYSLGVTLYELLTLRPAFPGDNRQDLLRRIAAVDPPAPRKIDSAVPRDLETVLLKAISKDPTGRYNTAAELAEDLQRFLDRKPIQARRGGTVHQLWRWAKRNPALSACIVAVFVLLVLVAAAGWVIAVEKSALVEEKEKAHRQAATERDAAEGYRREAQKVLERALRQTYRAIATMEPEQLQLLDDTVAYYETLLKERPDDTETHFEVASAFGRLNDVYYFCGPPSKGRALSERVIELVEPLYRDNPAEMRYRWLLAKGHRELAQQEGIPSDLAVKHCRRAIDLLEPLEDDHATEPSDLRLHAYNRVGFGEVLEGRVALYQEAELQLRQGVSLWQRLVNESGGHFGDVGGLAWARLKLARLLRQGNRFRVAEYNMLLALEPIETIDDRFWSDPANMSGRISGLAEHAQLMLCMQRPAEAERWARDAIAVAEGLLNDYPHFRWSIGTWARANRVLSDALLCLGRYEEAEKAGRSAIQGRERLVASVPSSAGYKIALAWSQYRLGERLWWIGRPAEAEALFGESRDRLEKALVQHAEERDVGRCLAKVLIVCPAAHLREPDRGLELALDHVQPEVGSTRQLLGAAYYRSGLWQPAIDALGKCTELNSGGDAVDWILLAMAHWHLEQTAEALHWYQRARDASDRKTPLGLQNFSHPFHLRDLLEEAERVMGTRATE